MGPFGHTPDHRPAQARRNPGAISLLECRARGGRLRTDPVRPNVEKRRGSHFFKRPKTPVRSVVSPGPKR